MGEPAQGMLSRPDRFADVCCVSEGRESMASMKDPLSSRWVQMVEQKFFCTILVAVGVGRAALSADRGQWLPGVPCCTTSSEPEAEGDRATTSLLRVLRAGADVALRDRKRVG